MFRIKKHFALRNSLSGIILLSTLLWVFSCSPKTYVLENCVAAITTVDSTQKTNPTIDQIISPYRTSMEKEMGEVIGSVNRNIEKVDRNSSQGPMGLFVADILLHHAQRTLDPETQIGLINQGGLRVPIPKGSLTVGKIYEVMPFDNMVSTAVVTGAQLDSLAQMIVGGKEAALAGVTIVADHGKVDIKVGGKPLDPTAKYKLVTIDYLMTGGSNMKFLKSAEKQINTGIFLRDFIIAYCKEETKSGRTIDFVDDKRVTIIK